jgi:hypothetical protein
LIRRTLTSACLSLNLSALDPHSVGGMSYRSHWETSYAVQSNSCLYEGNEQVSCWQSSRFDKEKSNSALDGSTAFKFYVPHVQETLALISLNPLVWSLFGHPFNHTDTQILHMQDASLMFSPILLVQNLINCLPEYVGYQTLPAQTIISLSFQTLFMQSLLESPDGVKTFSMSRCAQQLCSQSVNPMIATNSDRSSSCVAQTYWQDIAMHDVYYSFLCVNAWNLSAIESSMIDKSFLRWSCNDPFSRLRQVTARGLIQSHNEPANTVVCERDSRLMLACH